MLVCVSISHCYAQQDDFSKVRIIKFEEAIELAIQNNRDLKKANTNLAIAKENIGQAKMAQVPHIGLNGNYSYIGNPRVYEGFYQNGKSVDYINYQALGSIVTSMPLYLGGVITNQIEKQKLISTIQESVVKMTESDIKLAIAEQLFTIEKLYKQIDVTKQNIASTSLRIKQLKSRVENGQNVKSDLLRTELQQSNFEVSVFKNINTIALVSNYLDILTGLPTDTILKPEVSGILIPEQTFEINKLIDEAFVNRLEIKQSEINLKIAETDLQITKGGYKPNLGANLIMNTQYPLQWPTYINTVNFWAAGLSLNWDVSSFYNLKHRVNTGKLNIEKSNIDLEATKDQISKEVRSALVHYEESKKNTEVFKKNVQLSQTNYNIVKSKYDNEFALIIDMVDAEIQLNESKISLINANLDTIIQYYSLQYAMGKL